MEGMEVPGRKNDAIDFGSVKTIREVCEPCKYKDASTRANGVCRECEEYMCDSCFEGHKSIRACRHHVMIDDMPDSGERGYVKECPEHKGEKVKFYCRKHEVVGCGDCMVLSHNECGPEFIKDMSSQFKDSKEFCDLKTKVEKLEAVYKKLFSILPDMRTENNSLVDQTINDMQMMRKEIDQHLDFLEAKVIAKAKNIVLDNEKEINMLEERYKQTIPELESLNELLDANKFNDNALFVNAFMCKQNISVIEENDTEHLQTFKFLGSKQLLDEILNMDTLGRLNDVETPFVRPLYVQALREIEDEQSTKKKVDDTKQDNEGRPKIPPRPTKKNVSDTKQDNERRPKIPGRRLCDKGSVCKLGGHRMISAIIHLGDTSAEWALSFLTEPTDVLRMDLPYKESFCVLIKPNGKTLEAFGREAEDRYAELVEKGGHVNYFFFNNVLSDVLQISPEVTDGKVLLQDDSGRSIPALAVLSMAIKYLKDDLLNLLERRKCMIKDSDINFQLLYPSYFEGRRDMIQKAANLAGLQQYRPMVLLDMNAASYYYQYTHPEMFQNQHGLKFLLVNSAEESTQIHVQQVQDDNEVIDISGPHKIEFGSNTVYKAFENYLRKNVGIEVFRQSMVRYSHDYLNMRREVQMAIRFKNIPTEGYVVVGVPVTFTKKCKQTTGLKPAGDKIRVQSAVFKSFYHEAIGAIIRQITEALRDNPSVKKLFMFGHFSEYSLLLKAVDEAFPGYRIVMDENSPCTNIPLSGAVIAGHYSHASCD